MSPLSRIVGPIEARRGPRSKHDNSYRGTKYRAPVRFRLGRTLAHHVRADIMVVPTGWRPGLVPTPATNVA